MENVISSRDIMFETNNESIVEGHLMETRELAAATIASISCEFSCRLMQLVPFGVKPYHFLHSFFYLTVIIEYF